jgi:hypothetical protein
LKQSYARCYMIRRRRLDFVRVNGTVVLAVVCNRILSKVCDSTGRNDPRDPEPVGRRDWATVQAERPYRWFCRSVMPMPSRGSTSVLSRTP